MPQENIKRRKSSTRDGEDEKEREGKTANNDDPSDAQPSIRSEENIPAGDSPASAERNEPIADKKVEESIPSSSTTSKIVVRSNKEGMGYFHWKPEELKLLRETCAAMGTNQSALLRELFFAYLDGKRKENQGREHDKGKSESVEEARLRLTEWCAEIELEDLKGKFQVVDWLYHYILGDYTLDFKKGETEASEDDPILWALDPSLLEARSNIQEQGGITTENFSPDVLEKVRLGLWDYVTLSSGTIKRRNSKKSVPISKEDLAAYFEHQDLSEQDKVLTHKSIKGRRKAKEKETKKSSLPPKLASRESE